MKLRITIAGNTYEAEVEVVEEEDAALPYAPPAAPHISPSPQPASAHQHDPADKVCRSPVTGLVIRIPVQAGQTVEPGQLLVVLEAMKMETHVTAPSAGRVLKLHVAPGNSVKANQPLVEVDWQEEIARESER